MTIYALRLFFFGMEVTLTIPLALGVILAVQNTDFWLKGWKQSLLVGSLICLMILSRLDTAILAGLIAFGVLLHPLLRTLIRRPQLVGISLGLLPLLVYLLLNQHFFHVWLPISGMAKQLKFNHYPTSPPWHGLYLYIPSFFVVFLPIPIGILLYPFAAKYLSEIQRALDPAVLFFPLVYYFVLSCLSDWSIWPWYMYALRPAVCIAFVIFCTLPPLARFLQNTVVTTAMLAVFIVLLVNSRWRTTGTESDIFMAAVEIQQFALTHPGTYAMGDRTGRVGYLLNAPLINLEGLVVDKTFLSYVKRQTPLRTVLDVYDVRYYIAIPSSPYNGCFKVAEPVQAGPESPHMQGEFCDKPVARLNIGGTENVVFDLHPERSYNSK
jgi:hypothetical protein